MLLGVWLLLRSDIGLIGAEKVAEQEVRRRHPNISRA